MKKYFITGLIILLPVAVTVAVLVFLVNFLTKPFYGFVSSFLSTFSLFNRGFWFLSHEQLIRYGSKILILIFLFAITIALGIITRWFFIKTLLKLSDTILHRIPVVNTVYKTTQEITKTLFSSDKNSFKQVVMVPFPRPGVYAVGLIAREAPPACSKAAGQELVSVLMPTTPNPTTGFLMMFPASELIPIEMKPEEAIKFIVSCGVVAPGLTPPPDQTPLFPT
jgi:uncharacterized membrane protein